MNGTQASLSLGRTVYWNKMSVAGSPANIVLDNGDNLLALPLGSIGSVDGVAAVATGNRPGYTNLRNRPNGRAVGYMHDAPETGAGAFWMAAIDATAGSGVFLQQNSPQPAGVPAGSEIIWPHGCMDVVGSDTIIHAVARGSGDDDYDPIYYWRGDLNGTTVTWGTPVYIDSTATISPIVEADPTSNEVAIVYTKSINMAYTGGTAQAYNKVVVRKSADGGLTWGGNVNVHNQDTLVAGEFPYTDVAALYDDNGTLHVLYNTRDYREDAGVLTLFNVPARMQHWNDVRNTSRQIASLDINNTCNLEGNPFTIGAWNLAMAKPGITVKPAGVWGIPAEIFYAVWVQAGPDTADCATQSDSSTAGGYVNTEIWCSASSDDGLTWDRPMNITGTRTPNCIPGNCHSEHWVSAAARADSGIYLSYVDDSHSGGVVQGEGAWSLSNYMLYVPSARLPVVEPRISVSPLTFLEEHVLPGGGNTVQITVQNLGNATLNYQVAVTNDDNGQSHVLVENVTTYNSSILAAGAAHVLDIDFDGQAPLTNPSEHDWRLEVTSNDQTNDPGNGGSPIDVNLNVFVASPWFTCVRDTLSNGSRLVGVSSCLAIGNQGGGTGIKSIANNSEYLFEGSPVLSFQSTTAAQRLSWVDMFWSGVADRSRDSNRAYRAQSAISMASGVGNTAPGDLALTANIATGVASTTDSVFQLAWTVKTFNNPGYTDGFVARYVVTKLDDPGFNGTLSFGAAADLDVDSLSAWNDGITNASKQYIGARGGYGSDSTPYVPQNKWAALFYIPLDGGCDDLGSGGMVLDNPTYVYPNDAFHRDSLRVRMNGLVGWNAANFPTDSISDLSVLLKAGSVAYTGTQSATFAFGAAVSDVSIGDLESKIAKLKSGMNAGCVANCPITVNGDMNNSGTVTSADIITLVNFVFKGAAPPLPCVAAGDVNCSGTVTSADIITLVNFVFKGLGSPCNICAGSALAASCN
jgi:hypothetical protein